MKRSLRISVLYVLLLSFAFSCRKNDLSGSGGKGVGRTVIVYLAGDNNLSGELNTKISSLAAGFSKVYGSGNRMVVLADYRNSGAEMLEITAHGTKSIKKYGNVNMADPVVLKTAVADICSMFNSSSYGMICFSHATGWLPKGAFSDPSGYGKNNCDRNSVLMDGDDEMDFEDFAEAAKLPDGKKYEFMIFEMCHMSGIEIAYSLRNTARYMMASSAEIVSPGYVTAYESSLSALYEESGARIVDFAEAHFSYWNSLEGAYRSATVSVLDLEHIGQLAQETGNVVNNGKYLISDPVGIQHLDRSKIHLFFDLEDYMKAVSGPEETYPLGDFTDLLNKVVIYAAATPSFMTGYPYSFKIEKHCGLTVYIMQPELQGLNEEYRKTEFYNNNMK